MPRYRVNARFGPWDRGEEFESEDDFHAVLAAESGIITEVGAAAGAGEPAPAGGPPPAGSAPPAAPPARAPGGPDAPSQGKLPLSYESP